MAKREQKGTITGNGNDSWEDWKEKCFNIAKLDSYIQEHNQYGGRRMIALSILEVPDPRLRQVASQVERVDREIVRLMDDMLETMSAAPGIGLAAPQVGILKCVLVIDVSGQGKTHQPLRIANPRVLWASTERSLCKEGCLSLPDQYADVNRPSRIRVRYLDHRNEACEIETGGLLATVLQHEMDHLNGILFVDHLSKLKRDMILRRLQKTRRLRQSA